MSVITFLVLALLVPSSEPSKITDILQVLDLTTIDSMSYQVVSYEDSIEDSHYEDIFDLALMQGLYVTFEGVETCMGDEAALQIMFFENIKLSQELIEYKFIKNPCKSIMVYVENEKQMQELLKADLEDQPYLFAMKTHENCFEIFEVQIFSQLIKLIAKGNSTSQMVTFLDNDVMKRRSDFNGRKIRMVFKDADIDINGNIGGKMGETVLEFQKKFNFSIDIVELGNNWGTQLTNGTWIGSIGQLINGDLDISPLDLSNSPSRLSVVQAGHGFGVAMVRLYYPRNGHETYPLDIMLRIFSADSNVAVLISLLILTITLTFNKFFSRRDIFHSFEQSLIACVKAIFGQGFEHEYVMLKSCRLTIFVISIFGGLTYWHYTGVLISNLALPDRIAPFQVLDDLVNLNNFRLYTFKGGSTNNELLKWANQSSRNMDAYRAIVEPYNLNGIEDTLFRETKSGFGLLLETGYVMRAIKSM